MWAYHLLLPEEEVDLHEYETKQKEQIVLATTISLELQLKVPKG